MSVWRRKAIECLPECKKEFEQSDANIYSVFFELLPATHEAHKNKETEKLKKYYAFAEWCFLQKEKADNQACGRQRREGPDSLVHQKYYPIRWPHHPLPLTNTNHHIA